MSIPECISKIINCCFDNDNHIVHKPILLPCGGNSCFNCIIQSQSIRIKCFSCNEFHNKDDLVKLMPLIPTIDELIQKSYFSNLVDELKTRFFKFTESIKDEILDDMIKQRIDSIENEIDVKIESIIDELQKLREEFRNDLQSIKQQLKKPKLSFENDISLLKTKINDLSINYDDFFQNQDKLRTLERKLNDYELEIKSLDFTPNEKSIDKTIIGKLLNPLITFKNVKYFNKEINIPIKELIGIVYLKNRKNILINDCGNIKIYDENWNLVECLNGDKRFLSLGCFCSDKYDRLFIENFPKGNILIFDDTLKQTSDLLIEESTEPSAMYVDVDVSPNIIYLSYSLQNKIIVYYINSSKLKDTINIDSPKDILINSDTLIVLSFTGYLTKINKNEFKKIKFGSNCIFILNKLDYSFLTKIELNNWLAPCGLYLDKYSNIITTAFILDENKYIKNRHLFVFDFNGKLMHNIELNDLNYGSILITPNRILNWRTRFIKETIFN